MGDRPNKDYSIGYVGEPGPDYGRAFYEMRGKATRSWLPAQFNSGVEAVAAAGSALVKALNRQSRSRRKHEFARMNGAELAEALYALKLSATELSMLFGTSEARVVQWLDGSEDIPHAVRTLLAALHAPGAITFARMATETALKGQDDVKEDIND